MPFTRELPVWAKVGTKPPATMLNTSGWVPGDKPPADWLNWFFNVSYEAIKELQLESLNVDQKGIVNGIATLDADGKVPSLQLPPPNATATNISVADANAHFTGTNVEAVLDELFTFASDGKAAVANAVTAKGVSASPTDAFPTLATKIGQITKGQGNAIATQVLSGITFSNADGVLRTGSMANNSNTVITPGNVSKSIPAGYHYNSTVSGDINLVPENILRGKNIFGVIGNVKREAGGVGASNASALLTVTGLTFKPTKINISYMAGTVTSYQMSYDLSNRPKDVANSFLDGYARYITSNQVGASITPVTSDLTVSVWNTNSSGFTVTITHANISNISWSAFE